MAMPLSARLRLAVAVTLLALSAGACRTLPPHQSQAMPANPGALKDIALFSLVPADELSVRREFAVEGKTGVPAFVAAFCPVCGIPMLMAAAADKAGQEKTQAQEDAALLPSLLGQLGTRRTGALWNESLQIAAGKAKDMSFSRVAAIDPLTSSPGADSPSGTGAGKPFVLLELDHHLSSDLDKLRMKARARLFDDKGNTVSDQYYFYLPRPVPGYPKPEAVRMWAENGGERYRHATEVGVRSILDAVDLTLFSYKANANSSLGDASSLLARRHCFAGDYEAGIPLDAYNQGTLLAARQDYSLVRLANSDILIIPACE